MDYICNVSVSDFCIWGCSDGAVVDMVTLRFKLLYADYHVSVLFLIIMGTYSEVWGAKRSGKYSGNITYTKPDSVVHHISG